MYAERMTQTTLKTRDGMLSTFCVKNDFKLLDISCFTLLRRVCCCIVQTSVSGGSQYSMEGGLHSFQERNSLWPREYLAIVFVCTINALYFLFPSASHCQCISLHIWDHVGQPRYCSNSMRGSELRLRYRLSMHCSRAFKWSWTLKLGLAR